MITTLASVPLAMSFPQMVSFCGIGFLVVMVVLFMLGIFTGLLGKIFASFEKKTVVLPAAQKNKKQDLL